MSSNNFFQTFNISLKNSSDEELAELANHGNQEALVLYSWCRKRRYFPRRNDRII